MITVMVQQEQRLFREGLAMVLGAEPDLEVVGVARDGAEILLLAGRGASEVAVLDVDTDSGSSVRLISALRSAGTRRVVGLYRHLTRADARELQTAGADVLLDLQAGVEPVVQAVRGERCGRVDITSLARAPGPSALSRRILTRRELEVLDFVGKGVTSREISELLGISRKTVENHKQRTFQKLGVQNQAHAVSVAMRKGLFTPLEAARG